MIRLSKRDKVNFRWLRCYGIDLKKEHITPKKIQWLKKFIDKYLEEGIFSVLTFTKELPANATDEEKMRRKQECGLFRYYINQLKDYLELEFRDFIAFYRVKINAVPYFFFNFKELTNSQKFIFEAIEHIIAEKNYATTESIICYLDSYKTPRPKTNSKSNTLQQHNALKKPKATKINIHKIISELRKMGYLEAKTGKKGRYRIKNYPKSESLDHIILNSKSKNEGIGVSNHISYIELKSLENPNNNSSISNLFQNGIPALHDIRFKITMSSSVIKNGIKNIITLNNLPPNFGEKREAHITQYQKSTEIIIKCSNNPYLLNLVGLKELNNALYQTEKHLTELRSKNSDSPCLSYLAWVLTNTHYNIDIERQGGEVNIHLTWYDARNRLYRLYEKQSTNKLRLECIISGQGKNFEIINKELENTLQKNSSYQVLTNNIIKN